MTSEWEAVARRLLAGELMEAREELNKQTTNVMDRLYGDEEVTREDLDELRAAIYHAEFVTEYYGAPVVDGATSWRKTNHYRPHEWRDPGPATAEFPEPESAPEPEDS